MLYYYIKKNHQVQQIKDGFVTLKCRLFLISRNKQEEKLVNNGISSIGCRVVCGV